MTRILLIALTLSVAAVPAAADEFGRHRQTRAFWLNEQGWSNPEPQSAAKAPKPKYTMTYTQGVAERLGLSGGHAELFERKLGGTSGPALAGTLDDGAAKLVLRWHTDE